MDIIIQSARFTPTEIRKLNYCRLYLQAVTLSDITKPNGWELDPCLLQGRPSSYSSLTRWQTVNQDRPSVTEWKFWKLANTLWSNQNGRLIRALGVWIILSVRNVFNPLRIAIAGRSLYVLTENNK